MVGMVLLKKNLRMSLWKDEDYPAFGEEPSDSLNF
jgi:hypothetical protein